MRYSADAGKKLFGLVALGGFASLLAVMNGSVAVAAGSQVNATICGAGAGATITITTPTSDSVVDQPTVTLAGQVSSATQIEVRINDRYDSTIPLNPGQTNYSTALNLISGTQTIMVTANDICQVHDASASVVVTYQPAASPGNGDQTPTQVGVSVGGAPVDAADHANGFVAGNATLPVVGGLMRRLDFDRTARDGIVRGVLRVSTAVIGLALLIGGGHILGSFGRRWSWLRGGAVRLIGLGVFVLTFFI